MGKMCQSCGMPLNKDPGGGGTEPDGSLSDTFCSFCYQDGVFTQPDFTVQEMQSFCIEQLRKKGMPKVMAWVFTRNLPRLERWSKTA